MNDEKIKWHWGQWLKIALFLAAMGYVIWRVETIVSLLR